MVKITIECDDFSATTENPETAKTLLQMAGVIGSEMCLDSKAANIETFGAIILNDVPPTPKPIPTGTELKIRGKMSKEQFNAFKKYLGIRKCSKTENPTISKMEITETPPPVETTDARNASLPHFNPLWTAADVDFDKNYLQQYSNPCSTLHGNCGGECVQTELWLRNKKTGNLSVCDAEFATLDELRATLDPYVKLATRANAAAQSRKLPCSRERLEQLAKLFNAGKSDAEIMEQYHISASSVATYRAAAKRCGLLNN